MATTQVYTTASIEHPTEAQEHFADSYDMDSPIEAINNYARIMHLHTKRQMENATSSSRRSPAPPTDAMASLTTESSNESTASSINSQAS